LKWKSPNSKGWCHANANAYEIAVSDGTHEVPAVVELTPGPDGFFFRVCHEGKTVCAGFALGDVTAALFKAEVQAYRRLTWERMNWRLVFAGLREQGLEAGRQFPGCTLGPHCPQAQLARECPMACRSPICQAWEPAPEPEEEVGHEQ
jgi:hypothetical protein